MKPFISIHFISFFALITQVYAQYNFSQGLYRFPYEDNIDIEASNDMWNPEHLGKYDLVTDTDEPYIVAAADGWVRGIQDSYNIECHEDGNGDPCCWEYNNYVILEHPNGEWSGYTHIDHHSADDLGLELNQWVEAGDPLGIEGSIGCSTGPHLHFVVGIPPATGSPFDTIGGFLNGEYLIPVMCGNLPDQSYMVEGVDYTTGPCDDECYPIIETTGVLADGSVFVVRAGEQILTDNQFPILYANGSVSHYRAGESIYLRPGFQVLYLAPSSMAGSKDVTNRINLHAFGYAFLPLKQASGHSLIESDLI